MRIFSANVLVGTLLAFTILGANELTAKTPKSYKSAVDAYQQGIAAIQKGRIKVAIPALEYAADHEILVAQLQLARIYAKGELLPKDTAKAFQYYQDLADRLAEANPYHEIAEIAAEAFVAIADYYRSGLPELLLSPDYRKATRLYHYAASYFGDPEAQYRLAGMYLEGVDGKQKNVKMAVRWLLNASRKNHPRALALLGVMLWEGQGVKRDAAKGLALLFLATEVATEGDRKRIKTTYRNAIAKASNKEERRAGRIIRQWRRDHGNSQGETLPWRENKVEKLETAGADKPLKAKPKIRFEDGKPIIETDSGSSQIAKGKGSPRENKNSAAKSKRLATKGAESRGGPDSAEQVPDSDFSYSGLSRAGERAKPGTTFSDDGSGTVFDNESGTQFMGTGTMPVGATDFR